MKKSFKSASLVIAMNLLLSNVALAQNSAEKATERKALKNYIAARNTDAGGYKSPTKSSGPMYDTGSSPSTINSRAGTIYDNPTSPNNPNSRTGRTQNNPTSSTNDAVKPNSATGRYGSDINGVGTGTANSPAGNPSGNLSGGAGASGRAGASGSSY